MQARPNSPYGKFVTPRVQIIVQQSAGQEETRTTARQACVEVAHRRYSGVRLPREADALK